MSGIPEAICALRGILSQQWEQRTQTFKDYCKAIAVVRDLPGFETVRDNIEHHWEAGSLPYGEYQVLLNSLNRKAKELNLPTR